MKAFIYVLVALVFLFLYPGSLVGTNFLEEISFEITLKGEVSFPKVLLAPEESDSLNINKL